MANFFVLFFTAQYKGGAGSIRSVFFVHFFFLLLLFRVGTFSTSFVIPSFHLADAVSARFSGG
jgi:hypothetical protein